MGFWVGGNNRRCWISHWWGRWGNFLLWFWFEWIEKVLKTSWAKEVKRVDDGTGWFDAECSKKFFVYLFIWNYLMILLTMYNMLTVPFESWTILLVTSAHWTIEFFFKRNHRLSTSKIKTLFITRFDVCFFDI